jgi:hypothetical protein
VKPLPPSERLALTPREYADRTGLRP